MRCLCLLIMMSAYGGRGLTMSVCIVCRCGLPVVTTPIGAEGMGWANTGTHNTGTHTEVHTTERHAQTHTEALREGYTASVDRSSCRKPPTLLCPPSGGARKGGSWGGLVGWDEDEIVEAAARLYQDSVSPQKPSMPSRKRLRLCVGLISFDA